MNTQMTIEDLKKILAAKHGIAVENLEEFDNAELWLCSAIDANPIDCTKCKWNTYGLTVYEIDGVEYAVGNDSECDAAWNQSLDSYLEDCIYPELGGTLANYFDDEKWKRDAKFDGRGHSLSSYDGDEIEIGGDLYAYRIN